MCVTCLALVAAGMFYANITAHWSRIEYLTVLGIFCLTLAARHRWLVLRAAECGLKGPVLQRPEAIPPVSICPTCGHDLSGLDDRAVCPECGESSK